ncbi:hypothetical protein RHMOL_Rhmol03G0294000 [Rhododendron molle]|uniref:Uncharacterized protein n=1 Tax=Rhododendron molle TaxID=49168 RepID=A0ACC0PJG8_RHOML|nr:hypothetical protein RHMOL_Rhmol03G0294000 [Rhododendron molle]
MDEASALTHHKLFLLLLTGILVSSLNALSSTISTATTLTKPTRLVMKLIHSDSILSPYYNSNFTISEHARRAIKSSMDHYTYLKARAKLSSTMDEVRGGVKPDYGGVSFLVNFSIGQPPVPQLVVMDTGSNLLWIQCLPRITCFDQLSPIFDPSKSTTYTNLSCNSSYCVFDPFSENCETCSYYLKYDDGSTTRGDLGMEELSFMTSFEGTMTSTISNTVFGCGHKNDGFNGLASGVLGLGPNKKFSLMSHLGSKFSYCIGSITDPHYEHNQFIIGDGTKIEGDATPLEVYNNLYYITLQGISIGEKLLEINSDTFKKVPSGDGGVVIKTGTTDINLERGGYNSLIEEVQSLASGLLEKVSNVFDDNRLCYKGRVSQDLIGFPVVTFHFDGGADLVLDAEAMFEQNGEAEFCMAVMPAGHQDLKVIGIRAQQYYNVAYDLTDKKLYFQRMDCEVLN